MSHKDKHLKKAQEYYAKHDFEKAIYWYSRAISERSRDPEIYSDRAVAYFHHGNIKSALDDMNTAAKLEPNRAYRYSSRAYIKDAMGDVEGAIEDYKIAIKLDPEDAIAHTNLGLLQEKLGHHQQAKTLFEFADRIAEEQGDPEAQKRPVNIQKEIDQEKKESSLVKEMSKVFTSKKSFKEFLTFIRNGFK